jgi:hypothetical protein
MPTKKKTPTKGAAVRPAPAKSPLRCLACSGGILRAVPDVAALVCCLCGHTVGRSYTVPKGVLR